jgi:hypothetical protein
LSRPDHRSSGGSNGGARHKEVEPDFCIVADRAEVLKIWNAINPKDTDNVLVKVTDEDSGA